MDKRRDSEGWWHLPQHISRAAFSSRCWRKPDAAIIGECYEADSSVNLMTGLFIHYLCSLPASHEQAHVSLVPHHDSNIHMFFRSHTYVLSYSICQINGVCRRREILTPTCGGRFVLIQMPLFHMNQFIYEWVPSHFFMRLRNGELTENEIFTVSEMLTFICLTSSRLFK